MKKFVWSYFGDFFFVAKMYVNEKSGWVDFQDYQDVKYFKSFSEGSDWAEARCEEINDQYLKESE